MLLSALALALTLVLARPSAWAQPRTDGKPFVMGTQQEADTFLGRWQRRIYLELFRRLGLTVQFQVMPLQRLTVASEQGAIEGEVARIGTYAAQHPDLVRVDEPLYDIVWTLFSIDKNLRLNSLSELAVQPWRATYLRGIGICESALKAVVPPDRLFDVSTDAQGFSMLKLGRSELHCSGDLTLLTLQNQPEFRGTDISHRVIDIGATALYPVLHRRHADLAPRMVAALRQMKAEGLVERYRAEALRGMAASAVTR
ncbi:MAG: hypothetical protein HY021_03245 [Burkholderiales bacterium]|nr:hypothetical protein [Burkholderiales bacterium]